MRILLLTAAKKKALRPHHLSPLVLAASKPPSSEVVYLDASKEVFDSGRSFFDFAALSFGTADAEEAFRLSRELRSRGTKTLAMGAHPTFCAGECASSFDSVLAGEPEGAWDFVMEDLAKGALAPFYDCPPDFASKEKLPERGLLGRRFFDVISSSKGCRYRCAHCQVPPFYHGAVRRRSIPFFLAEAKSLGKTLFLGDDNFHADPSHARELLAAIQKLDKNWVLKTSIDLAFDRHLLVLAKQAKVRAVQLCLDSFSSCSLLSINNRHGHPEKAGEAIARFHDQGILVAARLSLGLEGDGPDAFERALATADSLGIDLLLPRIVPPLPGTEFYRQLVREGRVFDPDWSHYDGRHAVFEPMAMTSGELEEGYAWLERELNTFRRRLRRASLGIPGFLAAFEIPFQGG
ncbi:MAG TPA: B12-binding domain-containing radical SAM protein [Chroococcales cyanobacterium]|jgi:radical SAM superfamily enzyme YgiQ (UPF0313 family)